MLQARVKAINNILDQVTKQTEDCRIQLASIISAENLRECQGFIDKVSQFRFTKVKQLNKFNNLINEKQGNITRANATIWSNNLVSQTIRQASASPPPGEDNKTLPTNSQAGTNTNLAPAIAHLPPGEGSSFSQVATAHLPSEGSSVSQATALLPTREGSNALPAAAHLPLEGSCPSQATALLPSSEGSSNPQAGQSNNPTRSVRQGCRCFPRHRATQSSQENSTISQDDTSTTSPLVAPKVLPMKNPTLNGSLTFPTNP